MQQRTGEFCCSRDSIRTAIRQFHAKVVRLNPLVLVCMFNFTNWNHQICCIVVFAFQMELQFYFLTYEMHVSISNARSNLIYIWLNDYVNILNYWRLDGKREPIISYGSRWSEINEFWSDSSQILNQRFVSYPMPFIFRSRAIPFYYRWKRFTIHHSVMKLLWLTVLQLLKSAQMQHGLRHGDYTRYRYVFLLLLTGCEFVLLLSIQVFSIPNKWFMGERERHTHTQCTSSL
jgi:hypothetical protein